MGRVKDGDRHVCIRSLRSIIKTYPEGLSDDFAFGSKPGGDDRTKASGRSTGGDDQ